MAGITPGILRAVVPSQLVQGARAWPAAFPILRIGDELFCLLEDIQGEGRPRNHSGNPPHRGAASARPGRAGKACCLPDPAHRAECVYFMHRPGLTKKQNRRIIRNHKFTAKARRLERLKAA